MELLASPAAFSALVGAIYDCALDPARWEPTLVRLKGALRFHNAILGVNALPGGDLRLEVAVGIDSPWREHMHDHPADVLAVWGGPEKARQYPLDRPAVTTWANPTVWETLHQNSYLREWAHPQGLIDQMAIPLVRDASGIGTISMGRHRDAGPIGQGEFEAASLLLPHLQRAVAIGRLLEERSAADDLERVLDVLRTPVLVVTGDRTIRYRNAAAAALLDAATSLVAQRAAHGATLTASTPRAARALADAITRASTGPVPARTGAAVALPVGPGAHAAYVLPLHGRAVRHGHEVAGAVAVFVATPRAVPGDTARLASALFGLTDAEARVFDAIAAGATPAAIARDAGVAPSTVRTHLLRIFAKTGTRRQAELVRLAEALASPIAAPTM